MKKLIYILAAFVLVFTGCQRADDGGTIPAPEKEAIKVPITLDLRVPVDGPSTKAMADDPQIQNMVVVVFGGSGYFNEWVPVRETTEMADQNYNSGSNYKIYRVKFDLSQSDSRLRLHFIANCPSRLYSNPPITGISSQDLEDAVMSKIRSQLDDEDNDGYWAKILLPYGVQIEMEEEPNTHELKPIMVNNEYIPTEVTKAQIERYNQVGGIPMVRNFARIYLKNQTSEWTIQKFCLAYAPEEGPIAPILPAPITTNEWGERVVVQYAGENDETGTVYPIDRDSLAVAPFTVRELTNPNGSDKTLPALSSSTIYSESFFINYQNYPMTTATGEYYRKLSDAPFNYGGYSPADLAIGSYPDDDEGMTDWTATTPLYIYERAKPTSGQKATRIIVKAYMTVVGESSAKYYPLDLVDADGAHMAFLRNFTYTIDMTGLDDGSGYSTIAEAADATGANVSLDDKTADLNEVSNGISLIAVSYIDATYIKQGDYDVMFHYEQPLGTESNNTVYCEVGYGTGLDFEANTTAGNGSAFSGTPTIEKNNGEVVLYVKSGNNYNLATAEQIADASIEKWGRISYTTATVDRNNAPAINSAGYYTKGFAQTIRIYGGGGSIFRDVLINLTPLKTMDVKCLQPYINKGKDELETVRVYIPADLTRSMFPMTFKVELADYTLNPVPGSNMPVNSGETIINGETGTKFYFIRTLTRDEYNDLPEENGVKYFECRFQTTVVESATTVYVANEFFTTDSDSFHNYTQRLFTDNGALGSTMGIGAPVDYTIYLDAAHSSGTVKWNDDETLDDASDRIIPHFVTITMEGISPAIASIDGGVITYVNENIERTSSNTYKLTIPGSTSAPSVTQYTLHLVVGSEDHYSVTLSTSGNEPNPVVYADKTVSGEISKSHITNLHYENAAGQTITNLLALAGQEAYFEFTYGGELMPLTFKLNGFSPDPGDNRISGPDANGVYTFSPSTPGATQRFKLITTDFGTASITDIDVDSEEYAAPDPNQLSLTRFTYGITLPSTTNVTLGQSKTVTATVTPTDAPAPVITWSSADESVATVDANGVITALSEGSTTVTAAIIIDGQTVASANTTVIARSAYYSVTPVSGETAYGWTTSTVNPNTTLYDSYQSDNYHVASSIATMKLTIVGYTEFRIYVRSYGESSSDYLVVRTNALTSWNNPTNNAIANTRNNAQGGTAIGNYTLVTLTTANGLTADDTPHTFYIQYGKDNNTNRNDDRGYVLIPKEYNYVYIPTHVTGISLDRTSANVKQGGTLQLTETVVPDNADDKSVAWTTSDPSIATVSATGLVTVASNAPIGSTVTVTATTNDGHYTASCVVTVRNTTEVTLQTNSSTVTYSNNAYSYTYDGITISFGAVSERANNYIEFTTSSGTTANRRFTVSANGKTITKITLNFSRQNGTLTSNPGTLTNYVWTGSSSTIVFTNGQTNNNNRSRLASIVVEYEN